MFCPGANMHEQSKQSEQYEMAATCAGLGDSQVKLSCESRQLLLVPCLGPFSKRYRGRGLTEVGCCLFEKI